MFSLRSKRIPLRRGRSNPCACPSLHPPSACYARQSPSGSSVVACRSHNRLVSNGQAVPFLPLCRPLMVPLRARPLLHLLCIPSRLSACRKSAPLTHRLLAQQHYSPLPARPPPVNRVVSDVQGSLGQALHMGRHYRVCQMSVSNSSQYYYARW